MRNADFLPRGVHADAAPPMQPLRAGRERPREPAGALVETTNEHEELVRRGIDSRGEANDRAIELVDRRMRLDSSSASRRVPGPAPFRSASATAGNRV